MMKLLFAQRSGQRDRSPLNIPPISLMNPPDKTPLNPDAAANGSALWQADLDLGRLAMGFTADRRYTAFIRSVLGALVTDPQVIMWRQAVLGDFVRNPRLVTAIETLLPNLSELAQGRLMFGGRGRSLLLETSDRLTELELYTEIAQRLRDLFREADLQSPALTTLRDHLTTLCSGDNFVTLCEQLPQLRAPLQDIRSITVGINLDNDLKPISAMLLTVNDERFSGPNSLLERLLGTPVSPDDQTGIAPLHRLPEDMEMRRFAPFFQDLNKLLIEICEPVARALKQYARVSSAPLVALELELAFFVAAARLMERLQAAGLPVCLPEIAPPQERSTTITGLVNINLLLRDLDKQEALLVPNDVQLDYEGRIAVLTGPNSGGKTTYVVAVGLAHALAQAGLFVPAQAARISPVDAILTHFPALETGQNGRLAEESVRLRKMFAMMSRESLVLMNETFSSTASGEAAFLAQDVLAALRAIGARAIYATHLVELVERIAEIETAVEGDSRVYSLVAGVRLLADGDAAPTYQITRGRPLGRSYAREIARRYGISLEQILAIEKEK